jgi:hypothetical protein
MGYRTRMERQAAAIRFERSGLSRVAFAEREGVSANTLRRWLREHAAGGETASSSFVRLVSLPSEAAPPPKRGTRVVISANGFRVHVGPGFDADVLAGVLATVRGLSEGE